MKRILVSILIFVLSGNHIVAENVNAFAEEIPGSSAVLPTDPEIEVMTVPEEFVYSSLAAEEVVVPTSRKLILPPPAPAVRIGEDKWWTRGVDGYRRVPPPIQMRYQ